MSETRKYWTFTLKQKIEIVLAGLPTGSDLKCTKEARTTGKSRIVGYRILRCWSAVRTPAPEAAAFPDLLSWPRISSCRMHERGSASARSTMAAGGRPLPRAVGRPHYRRDRVSHRQNMPCRPCKPENRHCKPPATPTAGRQRSGRPSTRAWPTGSEPGRRGTVADRHANPAARQAQIRSNDLRREIVRPSLSNRSTAGSRAHPRAARRITRRQQSRVGGGCTPSSYDPGGVY
jgi:hypothetical protein